ncbi:MULTISPECIES: hypothetical protein [Vibrio]|uniref:hypothetical protein n=1 Tax=Vibrio TaxID=662 RepID=UPI00076AC01F|nr:MULTISPECIES: hypothetical protein [Vibrio]
MDIGSVLVGAFASILGVVATVAATGTIEDIKRKKESNLYLDMLYIEIQDIADECSKNLDLVYKVYAQVALYEQRNDTKYIQNYFLPNEFNLIILRSAVDKCFVDLTKQQRIGVRNLISLIEGIDRQIDKIHAQAQEEHLNITTSDVHTLFSGLGALYQLSLSLSTKKSRYQTIEKSVDDFLMDTLAAKKLSLDISKMESYLNAV